MLSAVLRTVAVLPLLLSLGGSAAAYGQQTASPAERQKKLDQRFLLHRGLPLPQQQLVPRTASPLQALSRARAHAGALRNAQAANAAGAQWAPAGPVQLSTPSYGLVTGRVSSLAADPNDPTGNTLYLGAIGGGVWKSTNAAAGTTSATTFTPLTDDIPAFANSQSSVPSLSIGAVTVQPGDAQVILAGTGDPNDALDSYYGVGLLRSADGGNSWSLIPGSRDAALNGSQNYQFAGGGFAGFAWSTATQNLVVAAVSQSYEGALVNTGYASTTELGLYYSIDAGQTWYLATIQDGANQVIQSSSKDSSPSTSNAATAVVWNSKRNLFIAAVRFHGYYSSPDGMTWTRLAQQPGTNLTTTNCPANPESLGSRSCPILRGALAVQPSTGDTFALTTDSNNADQGLYQDVCSTTGQAVSSCNSGSISFGTSINDTALDDPENPGYIDQADYNLALSAVASQGDTLLFAGTEDIYRCSLANSCTWRNTTNNQTCAAAQVAYATHAIEGTFGANGLLYFGNDGGLWRSTDAVAQTGSVCSSTDASHFQNLNGSLGSLAEISHLAVNASNGSLVLAGMGEFGVIASESSAAQGGAGAWQQLLTGEGSYVAISPSTPANWYADLAPNVAIFDCASGGNCNASSFGSTPAISATEVENDADYFTDAAPWILDPGNPSNILLGTCRMWMGPASGGWTSSNLISTMLDGDQGSFCDGNAELRSVAAGGSYNSAAGGERMYAGMAGPADGGSTHAGHIYSATVPRAGGQVTWTDLWSDPVSNPGAGGGQFNVGNYAISSIAVDPHDASGQTVYVGIGGFGTDGILYGSTDGGAHWSNLTNYLPLAPVNSIVVDPGSSSTVYVGGDFGVYYTTNIASCSNSSQGCWSVLGSGLPNAPVTDLAVYANGNGTVLEAGTYGRGIWTLGLATTSTPAQAALTPASYQFSSEGVGSASAAKTFTLSNTGSTPLLITAVAASPASDYAATNSCGSTLAANTTCTIQVTFTPSATGDRPGSLAVRANTASGTVTGSLDGTGLTPGAISMTPASESFPATVIGASSSPMNVTVQNTGGAPVTLGAAMIAENGGGSDFQLGSSACGSSLPAGGSCTLPVVFAPTQAGAHAAQLQLAGSAPGSPYTVNLSGTGLQPAALTLSPSSLAFTGEPVNSVSEPQSLLVNNTGGAAAQLGAPAVQGNYLISSNGCGATLAAGASCSVSIEFAPTATGSRAGLFTLPSPSIAGGQATASLSGNGTAAALTPASLSFAPQATSSTSAPQTITVTNTGSSAAQIGAPTTSGDFAAPSSSCPASLAAGAACSLSVTFTPTQTGSRTGSLTLPYNAGILMAALTGTGTAPGLLTFSPSSLTFPTTAENTTAAAQSVSVTNSGGSPAQLSSIAVPGPFALASNSCPMAPAALAVNAQCTLQFTFTPPGTAGYAGSAAINGSFSNSPAPISLSGQGATPPALTVNPSNLTFPDTPRGSASASQTLTLTSSGGVAVALGSPSVTANFQITSDNCPGSLPPGNSCWVAILFHPGGTGALTGTFSQPGTMTGSPVNVALQGNGLPPGVLTLNPTTFGFGAVVEGAASAPQQETVTNTGGSPIGLGAPSVTGDYTMQNSTCGTSLGVGQQCTLLLQFQPTAAGNRPGQLTVASSDGSVTAVATLDGTGLAPGSLSLMPSSVAFGTVATGSSASSSVTVTNSGGVTVHPNAISASGDFSVTGGSCMAGSAIAPSSSCTVSVAFSPSANGSRSGVLTIMSDGTPGTATADLAGVGAAPGNLSLSPTSLVFGSVVVNTSSSAQSVTARNSGGVAVSLGAPVLSGAGYSISGDSCGASLPAGGSCSVQIALTPPATGDLPGSLSMPGQYSGATATTSLDGQGVTPGALALTPGSVAFGDVVVNTSATQAISVQNTGGAPVTLGMPVVSSGFSMANFCGTMLAPGAACSVRLTFAPTSAGAVSGLLTFPASVSGGSVTGALSGNGVLPGALTGSPGTLNYAATVTGGETAAQTATFQNPGGVSVPLAMPQVSSSDFVMTSTSCGAALAPGAFCTVSVAFTPLLSGSRSATLTLASSASNGPAAHVALAGTGLAPAHLVWAPASISFGGQNLNTTSPSQSLTLSNSGGVATNLAAPVLTGQYALTANTCNSILAAGGSCTVSVQFAPTNGGSQSGTLTMAAPGGSPSAAASLSGTGWALALAPTAVAFQPPILVGANSAPVAVAVENLSSGTVTLQPFALTGDFSLGNSSCGATLAPQSSCGVYVTFTPSAGGQRTGLFTASDGVETHSVQLSGTGLLPATDTLGAASLAFGQTIVGQVSKSEPITLTNSGDATLTQIATATTGPFVATNNCGASLGGHLACVVAVSFAPVATGSATGTLVVTDSQRSQTVTLSGDGAAPPQAFASPTSINFGPYALSIATAPQMITISNGSSTPTGSLSAALSGSDFSLVSNSCQGALAPSGSCQIGVVFTPTAVGNREGTVTVSSGPYTAPFTISLAGSGEDFQLAVVGAASAVITSGQTATYQLSIAPVGASSGVVTLACSGAPANAVCTANPTSVTPSGGASSSVTLSVATAQSGVSTAALLPRWLGGTALALLLVPRRHRRRLLVVLLAAALLGSPLACGVHASGVNGSGGGTQAGQTPSGSYTLVVSASFPGATRSAAVSLVVQ